MPEVSADIRGTPCRRYSDASGYRLGSTMEFAGYDQSLEPETPGTLATGSGVNWLSQEPVCEPVLEEWYGWRPMTYGQPADHRPQPRLRTS